MNCFELLQAFFFFHGVVFSVKYFNRRKLDICILYLRFQGRVFQWVVEHCDSECVSFHFISAFLVSHLIFHDSYCKCEMPYNPDDLMVQCEGCTDW